MRIQHVYPICRWVAAAEVKDFGVKPRSLQSWCRRNPDGVKRLKCGGKTLYWLPDVLRYMQGRQP